jgi:hypothetical protein
MATRRFSRSFNHALATANGPWHCWRSVRFSILFFFTVMGGSVIAQEQEKTLEQRLLGKPDEKAFDLRQGSTFGRQSFVTGTARVKNFYFTQKFAPKDYDTRAYGGTKSSWFGNFKFSTREAGTKGNYEIPNATKKADTKTLPVSDARENSKTMSTTAYAKRDRPYLGPEANRLHRTVPANGQVGWTGDLRPMTIDDVRELLNKNK